MKSKVVVITGSSRGIGAAIAELFSQNGWSVGINYAHDETAARAIYQKIVRPGVTSLLSRVDVSTYKGIEELIERNIEFFGKIDTMVFNAGAYSYTHFNPLHYRDLHVLSPIHGIRIIASRMKPWGEGSIIVTTNCSSIQGNSTYNDAGNIRKEINDFVHSYSLDIAPVTLNAVAPGIIKTDMLNHCDPSELNLDIMRIPLGRAGTASEAALAYFFLANASYVTGQIIVVDGGLNGVVKSQNRTDPHSS